MDKTAGGLVTRRFFLVVLLELELIQTHMIQKPMLRVEVCTRALRASQNVKKEMRALCVRSA
jgi:ribosomal protein L28